MAKLECPCGFVHNLLEGDNTFVVVKQKHYPRLVEAERALARIDPRKPDHDTVERELGLQLVSLKQRLCECPKCGRLAWFRAGVALPTFYWLEE
jgi:hypothetical protein